MKKQTQKSQVIEHYLVPAALFVLNFCAVHVIYAYSTNSWISLWHLIALTAVLVALTCALALKNSGFLLCSIAAYLLILTYWW